jgi:hypothetical protein
MTVLKVGAGIAAAMFVVWSMAYSSRGRRPAYAAAAAILTGFLLLLFVLWAYLHP